MFGLKPEKISLFHKPRLESYENENPAVFNIPAMIVSKNYNLFHTHSPLHSHVSEPFRVEHCSR